MTENEKRQKLADMCYSHDDCVGCAMAGTWCEKYNPNNIPVDLLDKVLGEADIVNKPKHYNRQDAMECIDEMILVFGKQAVKTFCLCNVWKYRYRAKDKNGEEDIKKSDWYMKKYQELSNEEMAY